MNKALLLTNFKRGILFVSPKCWICLWIRNCFGSLSKSSQVWYRFFFFHLNNKSIVCFLMERYLLYKNLRAYCTSSALSSSKTCWLSILEKVSSGLGNILRKCSTLKRSVYVSAVSWIFFLLQTYINFYIYIFLISNHTTYVSTPLCVQSVVEEIE